jgi:HD-like signal output (HDOD) protein
MSQKRQLIRQRRKVLSVDIGTLSEMSTPAQQVRLVLLHDRQGKVLALLPPSRMLDLTSVAKLYGRELQAARVDDAQRFFTQPGLQTEAGQAKLLSLPLLLDSSLGEAPLSCNELHSGLCFTLSSVPTHDQVSRGQVSCDPATSGVGSAGLDDATVITRAVERFTSLRVQQRLEDTLGLPGLSQTMRKIVMLRSDPEAGVDELVPVVKLDPSLSAQVMGWASSPYYAAPGRVRSIEDAIIRVLGFDLVINLALGVAMGLVLRLPEDTPRGTVPYWEQAVYTATLSEKLARSIPLERRPRPGLAYLAGLLHNFGYLVLGHLFPPHFSRLSRHIEANPQLEQSLIEQEVLHVTREQVGGWLLESWKLPAEVSVAVRYQHEPGFEGEHAEYARLLYLASRLLRQHGMSAGPAGPLPDEVMQELGLQQADLEQAMLVLKADAEGLSQLSDLFSSSAS